MKYPVNFESPRAPLSNFMVILGASILAAAAIGALVGLVGYVPRIEFLVMIPSVAMGGMMIGMVVGPILAYALFRGKVSNRAFYGSAALSLLVGLIGAVIFRLLTDSQGGWLAGFPAIIGAIVAAIWFRIKGK